MQSINVIPFEENLLEAYLVKREKRFFVEFTWEAPEDNLTDNNLLAEHIIKDNHLPPSLTHSQRSLSEKVPFREQATLIAHTNNTGSMLGLLGKGRKILLSKASNPNRKLAWTLEAVSVSIPKRTKNANMQNKIKNVPFAKAEKTPTLSEDFIDTKESWIGVNTSIPNTFLNKLFLLQCAFPEKDILPWAKGYTDIRMETVNGESRLDALIYKGKSPIKSKANPTKDIAAQNQLWVECKSVTLVEDRVAAFPDAVSARGTKHLESLMRIKKEGARAVMLYIIQRMDGLCFAPADYVDALYGEKLLEAYSAGVEVYTVVADVRKDGIYYGGTLPLAPCFIENNSRANKK